MSIVVGTDCKSARSGSGIIYERNITLKDCLEANKYSPAAINKLQTIDVIAWSKESRNLLDSIYNTRGAKIKDDYVTASAITIESQMQKAGIRLAGILNSLFKL